MKNQTSKNFDRRDFLKSLGICAATAMLPGCAISQLNKLASTKKKPNFLFFLVDDMGWMDTTVYGSKYYETPNIERLAKRGMMFTDAYAANPLCTPTRASILTGKFPARFGIIGASGHIPPQPKVPLMAKTAAPWMKMVCQRSRHYMPHEEYTVAEALKENGYKTGFIGKWHLGHDPFNPESQGFDVNIAGGAYPGPPSYFSPYKIHTLEDGPNGEYLTDRLTEDALKYLENNKDDPFMLCMWHYAVHSPHQAKKEITKKYREKVDPRGKQDCPTMASMLQSMDESLGKILDKLDALNLTEDTIIIFMSDNGGVHFSEVDRTTPTNNYPLREGKATLYEGGTREPCIVVWPGVVKPDSTCTEIIQSIDFFPTMLEIAGIKLKKGVEIDGQSIVPLLTGKGKFDRETIFCHFPTYVIATKSLPGTYVRKGDWKLIRLYGEGPNRSNSFELYNLKDDISETKNLADKMPKKVKELDALISQHLKEIKAPLPVPNPSYNKKLFNLITDKPIQGWIPGGTCNIFEKDGLLIADSFGGDPSFYNNEIDGCSGDVILKIKMKSSSEGNGLIFWKSDKVHVFQAGYSVDFNIFHDNKWHEYSVKLPVKHVLKGLRIDPCTKPGKVEFEWIEICSPDGKPLKKWKF